MLKTKKLSLNIIAIPRTSGLQAVNHPHSSQKERQMREGERERQTFKGKGELYNMPQYHTLPPKCPRSGVTFHYSCNFPLIFAQRER